LVISITFSTALKPSLFMIICLLYQFVVGFA
jgi:hypothetical protein